MPRHYSRQLGGAVLVVLLFAAPLEAGPLLDGLDRGGTFADLGAEFDARLLDLHPPESSVAALWVALEAEEFDVAGGGRTAGGLGRSLPARVARALGARDGSRPTALQGAQRDLPLGAPTPAPPRAKQAAATSISATHGRSWRVSCRRHHGAMLTRFRATDPLTKRVARWIKAPSRRDEDQRARLAD